MATRTFTCSKDARIAPSNLGAGTSDFNPVGDYGGYDYRTLIDFSNDYSGMVSITKAILKMRVSTQHYVQFSSAPTIDIRRISSSWSEGTSSGLSASNGVRWDNQPGTTGSTKVQNVSTTEGSWTAYDITTIMQEALAAGGSFYGLQLKATASSDVTEFYAREQGSSDPYIEITYTTAPSNVAPTKPTGITPTGQLRSLVPGIQFDHVDPDGDALLKYDLQVGTDPLWATATHWNVANQTAGITGNRVLVAYGGTALARNTTYYWRARTYSGAGVLTASPWSDNGSFLTNSLPVPTLAQPSAIDALVELVKVAGSANGPRMVVRWNFSDPNTAHSQTAYQVVVVNDNNSAFYSGVKTNGADTSFTVPVDVVRNAFYKVTVTVWDTLDEAGSTAQRRCRAQWALAEYRTTVDLGAVTQWAATPLSTVAANQAIVTEYGSSTNPATGLPFSGWKSTLASAPLDHVFHWRVWLFAWSGAASPTFRSMSLAYTSDTGVVPDGWVITSQHSLDTSVRVFGTQSLKAVCNGTLLRAYQKVHVEKNTDYILSGRIKADGNPRARLALALTPTQDPPILSSPEVVATQGFGRVATAIWNSGENEELYVGCGVLGAAPAQAWFDAVKLEASTVVTAWTPGFVGAAVTVDAGGIQIDKEAGGLLRLKARLGALRDIVELTDHGLSFGGSLNNPVEVYSDAASELKVGGDLEVTGALVAGSIVTTKPIVRGYPGVGTTAQTSYTWTKPAGLAYIVVETQGGGGGGGGTTTTGASASSAAGGGGGGGYAKSVYPASQLAASHTLRAGGGGAGGAVGTTGGNGGTSDFGATGNALLGGATATSGTGGNGGAGSGASTATTSVLGGTGGTGAGDVTVIGGAGGSSGIAAGQRLGLAFGGGSALAGTARSSFNSGPGNQWGGGASGGAVGNSGTGLVGDAGARGVVFITEYYV